MKPILPHLQYLHHVSAECFAFLQIKKNFSILVLYTQQGEVYLQYDGLNRQLPTCNIGDEQILIDSLENTLSINITTGNMHLQSIKDKFAPILLIDNTFCYKRSAHTVFGIVYAIKYIQGIESRKNTFTRNIYLSQKGYDNTSSELVSQGMFLQLDDDTLENTVKNSHKDILSWLYNSFLPQTLLGHNPG